MATPVIRGLVEPIPGVWDSSSVTSRNSLRRALAVAGVLIALAFAIPRVAALVAAPLVAFALAWRRPDLGTAGVFLWFAALQGLAVVFQIYRTPEVEPIGALRWWMGVYGWLVCWAPAAFLHFLAVFPRP